MRASRVVLDSSAVLAYLHGEPGGERVEAHLAASYLSSVNWAEVVQKGLERGVDVDELREDLAELGLIILPFMPDEAEMAGRLRERTRHLGLALGDRACIALALRLGVPAVTADRAWQDLAIGVDVHVVR